MPITLGEIKRRVRFELAKRDTFDEVLPFKINDAIAWIERNHSLKYMERFINFPLAGKINGPYKVLPNYKNMSFVRLKNVAADYTAEYKYLTKVTDWSDFAGIHAGDPDGYWVDAGQWLWFDAIPSEHLACELVYLQYTGQLADGDSLHWLFEFAPDVVVYRTVMSLLPTARITGPAENPNAIYSGYQRLFEDGLKTLIQADAEERLKGTSARMGERNV